MKKMNPIKQKDFLEVLSQFDLLWSARECAMCGKSKFCETLISLNVKQDLRTLGISMRGSKRIKLCACCSATYMNAFNYSLGKGNNKELSTVWSEEDVLRSIRESKN